MRFEGLVIVVECLSASSDAAAAAALGEVEVCLREAAAAAIPGAKMARVEAGLAAEYGLGEEGDSSTASWQQLAVELVQLGGTIKAI